MPRRSPRQRPVSTAAPYDVSSVFQLGYDGEPAPPEVLADEFRCRWYRDGREARLREQYGACCPAEPATDPAAIDGETVYRLTRDLPEFGAIAGDYLVVWPGQQLPVLLSRPLTAAVAFAMRDALRVIETEHESYEEIDHTPAPIRHLTLVR